MTNNPFFPIWQVDQQEYNAACKYLNVSPKQHLFEKLSGFLVHAPFVYTRPKGFSLFLAKPKLSRFRIARLDMVSNFLIKNHPIRHVLNGVIALYECDGEGYPEISVAPQGWRLLPSLVGWGISFMVSLIITMFWVSWQYMKYLISSPFRAKENLTGKKVFISGAGRGLGLEILLYSLQQGAEVIGTVRSRESYNELVTQLPKEAPVTLLIVDLSKPNAITEALQEQQVLPDSIDIAVLCAGIKHSDTSVLSMSRLRETFEVNLFSSIEFSKWLCASDHKASLVLVSSIGRWHGMHSSGGYNASKAALSIWGESLEMELYSMGNKNLNIMIVEPGIFESGMMKKSASSRFLFASRYKLSEKIISGALSGKKVLRYPFWFALLTWTICLGGRNFQNMFFASASKSINKSD